MKGIYSVAVLSVATLAAFTLGQSAPEVPTKCPKIDPMNTTIHLAHESDCTKFYMCHMGKKIEKDCPFMDKEGHRLHFNPVLQVCDWPWQAGCEQPPPTTTTPTTTTSTSKTDTTPPSTITPNPTSASPPTITTIYITPDPTPTDDDNTITSIISPSTRTTEPEVTVSTITPPLPRTTTTTPKPTPPPPESTCPKDTGGATIKIPHETKCEYYYLCTDGEKSLQQCSRGLVFNPTLRICDFPENVNCEGITLTTKTLPQECPSKGFGRRLPHECQCDRFYECQDGNMVRKFCPTGLHYDRVRMVCDDPSAVKCERSTLAAAVPSAYTTISYECSDEENGWRYQHETSCTSYYECRDRRKVLKHCAPGLHFNVSLQICEYPEKECQISTPKLPDPPTSVKTTPGIRTTTESRPSNVCPPKGSNERVLLPHECSCTNYYECVDGKQVVRTCSSGLEYDYVRQTCDDPQVVNCVRPIPPTPKSTARPTPRPTTPVIGDDKCPEDNTRVKFPDKTNCTRYYECVYGKKVLHSCRWGFVFNPTLRICDFPENVKEGECALSATFPVTNSDQPNPCPSVGKPEMKRLPHECDCAKYYYCFFGMQILQDCPKGLKYDYKRSICDEPEAVECSESPPNPTPSPSPPTLPPISSSCKGKKDGTKLPDPLDCSSYYECYDQVKVAKQCRNHQLFNPRTGTCDFPENVKCGTRPVYECPATGTGKIPHKNKCKLYYDCVDGEKILRDCGNNNFNPVIKACDFPENYPCEDDDIVGAWHTAVTEKPTGCIGTCPWKDPANYTVLIPNENCHKFCMCSNGIAYVQDCPGDLLFDYKRNVCDFPQRVVCKVPPANVLETEERDEDGKDDLLDYAEKDYGNTGETNKNSGFRLPTLSRYI